MLSSSRLKNLLALKGLILVVFRDVISIIDVAKSSSGKKRKCSAQGMEMEQQRLKG
jgi:hypothetical protein